MKTLVLNVNISLLLEAEYQIANIPSFVTDFYKSFSELPRLQLTCRLILSLENIWRWWMVAGGLLGKYSSLSSISVVSEVLTRSYGHTKPTMFDIFC